MTARGFGKRDGEELEFSDNYSESRWLQYQGRFKLHNFFLGTEKPNVDQQINDDYRDVTYNEHSKQNQPLFPFTNQFMRNPSEAFLGRDSGVVPSVKSHRLQIRDGTLKFRLNDGNLRIGRGFGKRSYDPYIDK